MISVTWLAITAGLICVLVSTARIVTALQKARIEQRREQTEWDRLLRVQVTPVSGVNPTDIGIDPASQAILPGAEVPSYVTRAADRDLQRMLTSMLRGETPWVIVVRGPSKVGKSRTLLEALRHHPDTANLPLVAPVDGSALKSLACPGQTRRWTFPKGPRSCGWMIWRR